MFTNLMLDPTDVRLLNDDHRKRLARLWGRPARRKAVPSVSAAAPRTGHHGTPGPAGTPGTAGPQVPTRRTPVAVR